MAVAVLLGAAAVAQENGYAPIEMSYQITRPTLLAPPPNEKKDRLAIFMTGAGARRIYDAMPMKPIVGICEDGMLIKTSGALACSRQGKDNYVCTIAVFLRTDQSTSPFVC